MSIHDVMKRHTNSKSKRQTNKDRWIEQFHPKDQICWGLGFNFVQEQSFWKGQAISEILIPESKWTNHLSPSSCGFLTSVHISDDTDYTDITQLF